MTHNCFTYGSLMCEDIMSAVCGVPLGSLQAHPARLSGYIRHPIMGETYPGMTPSAESAVHGIVYRGLNLQALLRLDAFEGAMYERRTVSIETADGDSLAAETYIFRPEFSHLLGPGDWDFPAFLSTGKAEFLSHYGGFLSL